MAISSGIGTKGTGKIGSMVYSVNHGVQVVREYQPSVSNPSTDAQVAQRARLKLMSQISAALSNVLAYQRDGLTSPRNAFTKANFDICYASESETDEITANVSYANLQLAQGSFATSGISVTRSQANGIVCQFVDSVENVADRVCYILARKNSESKIEILDSAVVSTAGDDGVFPYAFDYVSGPIIVWAYAMETTSASANGKYLAYTVKNASQLASLVANRNLIENGVRFSYTQGVSMKSGEDQSIIIPDGYAAIYLDTNGYGTIQDGSGTVVSFPQVVEIGTEVSFYAIANSGYEFSHFLNNVTGEMVAGDNEFNIEVDATCDWTAVFIPEQERATVTLTTSGGGTVKIDDGTAGSTVTKTVVVGTSVTLTAIPYSGRQFAEWDDDNTDNPRTIVVEEDVDLAALFL